MRLADSKISLWGISDAIPPLQPSARQSLLAMSMLTTFSLQKQMSNFSGNCSNLGVKHD
jgi:hypothetical protein